MGIRRAAGVPPGFVLRVAAVTQRCSLRGPMGRPSICRLCCGPPEQRECLSLIGWAEAALRRRRGMQLHQDCSKADVFRLLCFLGPSVERRRTEHGLQNIYVLFICQLIQNDVQLSKSRSDSSWSKWELRAFLRCLTVKLLS